MPVHRPRAAWLLDAVRSALAEPRCDVELIVVDDGSPEPVAELLEPIADPRMRVIRVAHGGASRARNAGLAVTRAPWVRFVDADDVCVAGGTERLLRLTGGDERILAYGATAFCDEQLRQVWTMRCALQGDALVDCLLGRFTVRPQSLLFSRHALQEAGPWDPSLAVCHDWDLVLRVLEHTRVRGSGEIVTRYRRHGGGLTASASPGTGELRKVMARYFERHPEQRESLEQATEAVLHAMAARIHVSHRQPREGVIEALTALRLGPRALLEELARSQAALRGHARRRLRSR